MRKGKKATTNVTEIYESLRRQNHCSPTIYKTFNNHCIIESLDGPAAFCLESILNKKILPLFKGRFLVKYLIYGEETFKTPFYDFEQKKSIESILLATHEKKYNETKLFAIRIDFIDIDSNLESFIILLY